METKAIRLILACELAIVLLAAACAAGHGEPAPNAAPAAHNDGLIASAGSSASSAAPLQISWIPISQGIFTMGCSLGDGACKSDEKPAHQLLMPDFHMTATKITQAQYAAVAGRNPSYFQPEFGWAVCPNCPVESVTWPEAQAFCQAVGGRLPTEAEWEYAARAFSDDAFVCGKDAQCLADDAWYAANSGQRMHAVEQKLPNFFDLYDMIGDAYEWTGDWYGATYYSVPQLLDPQGPATGQDRVVRGGGWLTPAGDLRVSARNAVDPNDATHYIGFRCVY